LRKTFIVYLLSHDRPMSEVIAPTCKDISDEFLRGFEGMTEQPVSRNELIGAREALIADTQGQQGSRGGRRRSPPRFRRQRQGLRDGNFHQGQ
jgi:hypothetical protein